MRAFVVLQPSIYYIEQPEGETRFQFFDFASGRSMTVAGNVGEIWAGFTATRDGRAVLYSSVNSSDDLMLVEGFR